MRRSGAFPLWALSRPACAKHPCTACPEMTRFEIPEGVDLRGRLGGRDRGMPMKRGPQKLTGAPAQTGRSKQVSEKSRHRQFEQVLPREEFTPGKSIPCAAWGDPRGEA